jgi:adenylate kinase
MLTAKGLKLDGVIELKVDGGILQNRIAKRVAEAAARGAALRPDDNPDVLRARIQAYREQTAPLVDYYRWQGALKTVDGMAAIPEVARASDQALAAGAKKKMARKRAAPKPAAGKRKAAKPAGRKAPAGRSPRVPAGARSPRKAVTGGKSAVHKRKPSRAQA